jgi:uncharacterized protein
MGRKEYIIRFGGLKVGVHEFQFEVKETFFKGIENSEIERAEIEVTAELTKQNNLMQLSFDISGTVDVDCDRCLKTFGYPVEAKEVLVVKHGNPEESNDEILVIPEGQEEIDISQYLYEYISLSIPARRVPCEVNEELYECDYEMLDKLDEVSRPEGEEEPDNPLWEQLNKIKYNKN